jgi:hypothetical protein
MTQFNYPNNQDIYTLTADRTYYVRTDGSDSNNGLADTSGGAFLTIQKAIDVACTVNKGLYNITIQVDNGTYTTPLVLKRHYGDGTITIKGDSTTPSNVVISTTSANCFTGGNINNWILDGLKLQTITSSHCINLIRGSEIQIKNLDFGSAAGGYHISLTGISNCLVTGNYTISGTPTNGSHIICQNGSAFRSHSNTITVLNTPAFSATTGFAFAQMQGSIDYYNCTFSGSATGRYYYAIHGGYIRGSNNGNFPGNSAGTTATNGYYST